MGAESKAEIATEVSEPVDAGESVAIDQDFQSEAEITTEISKPVDDKAESEAEGDAESKAEIATEVSEPVDDTPQECKHGLPISATCRRCDLEAGWVGIGNVKDCHPLTPVPKKRAFLRRSHRLTRKVGVINRPIVSTSASRRTTVAKTRKPARFY